MSSGLERSLCLEDAVCNGGQLTGILDWDVAHIGHPAEDLARALIHAQEWEVP